MLIENGLLRIRAELTPVLHGGGQEREVRSGTLDAPAIAGFAIGAQPKPQLPITSVVTPWWIALEARGSISSV